MGLTAEAKMHEENRLLALVANKDQQAFSQLLRLYQAKVRAYCYFYTEQLNEEADDLSQDIFLEVYLSAPNFRQNCTVNTWIFSIAKNTISNKLRKKKLLYFWRLDSALEVADGFTHKHHLQGDIVDQMLRSENHEQVRRAILGLKAIHKEVLVLYEYSGLNYEQLSVLLKVSVGTVRSRLFNARKALAKKVLSE